MVSSFATKRSAFPLELFDEKPASHGEDSIARSSQLPEDVFHLVEDGGVALGRLVFDLQSRS